MKFRKLHLVFLGITLSLFSSQLISPVNAGEFIENNDKTKPGIVKDKGRPGTEVFIRWTDKDGNTSIKTDTKIIPEGKDSVDFPVPGTAVFCPKGIVIVNGKEVCFQDALVKEVKDFRQFTKPPRANPAPQQLLGPISILEVASFEPIGEDFLVIPFTNFIASNFGINKELRIPDLYADTNNDSSLGEGDTLYSFVNLTDWITYINSGFTFNIGDSFSMTNGLSTLLPGFVFGTEPIIRDPNSSTGVINPSPFTGNGFVLTEHRVEVVPEPTSTLSLLALCTLGVASTLKRKLKPSQSTEKETTKVG